ncbi:hypothetical protein Aple_078280 [Acrocarpospora pleiomorpha]|uniref:Uncharacterized protein n=1 Tax=Acrocarpospora pleiomorpha TaxID=90975 RepID=A0A5M3XY46_9ACTN|nr:hypothetical protein Aple_078280 [Acrocarpospora pleiomorpha]
MGSGTLRVEIPLCPAMATSWIVELVRELCSAGVLLSGKPVAILRLPVPSSRHDGYQAEAYGADGDVR